MPDCPSADPSTQTGLENTLLAARLWAVNFASEAVGAPLGTSHQRHTLYTSWARVIPSRVGQRRRDALLKNRSEVSSTAMTSLILARCVALLTVDRRSLAAFDNLCVGVWRADSPWECIPLYVWGGGAWRRLTPAARLCRVSPSPLARRMSPTAIMANLSPPLSTHTSH